VQIGIVGLPSSGKTTVFEALTGSHGETSKHKAGPLEPSVGVVKVPDARLHHLASIFKPKRIVHATVKFIDLGGITRGSVRSEGMSKHILGYLTNVDALLEVVRVFESDTVPHPDGTVDPVRDLETINLELSFWDLEIIERRLIRIDEMAKKVRVSEREAYEREADILRRLRETLESGGSVRDASLNSEEKKIIRGHQFLTEKPALVLLNVGESQLSESDELVERVSASLSGVRVTAMALAAELEMEIAQLPEQDARDFLADAGLKEPGADRVIKASYDLVDLISFLTGGPDEVRAWPIPRGSPAQKAAGAVHTDIEKGFIRAEVVGYDDLIAAGNMAEVRKRGQLRLEGKSYEMHDGDVVNYLFNV
jgi:ribosome-binding ATPase